MFSGTHYKTARKVRKKIFVHNLILKTSIASQACFSASLKLCEGEVMMFPQFLEMVDGEARNCWTYSSPSDSCFSCRSIRWTGFPVLDHY
jgi:hypothetical protein